LKLLFFLAGSYLSSSYLAVEILKGEGFPSSLCFGHLGENIIKRKDFGVCSYFLIELKIVSVDPDCVLCLGAL